MKSFILAKENIGKKLLLTGLFLVISLVLPQILHFMPIGNLGKSLLPINFSIILASILLGKSSGIFLGVVSPLISYVFFNMPNEKLLPLLMIECILLGIFAEYFKDKTQNNYLNIGIALFVSIMILFVVVFLGSYVFSFLNIKMAYTMVKTGILGMSLQILLIPILVEKINNFFK